MEILNFTQISIQDMLLVCKIAEYGSVSRAALELRLSQPTASYRLNKMRELFEDQVFVSAKRTMKPTSKGLRIIQTFDRLTRDFQIMVLPEVFDPMQTRREFKILAQGFQISAMYKKLPNDFFKQTRFAKLFIEPAGIDASVNHELHNDADFLVAPFMKKGAKGIRRYVSPKLKVVIYYDANIRSAPKNLEEYSACRFVMLESLRHVKNSISRKLENKSKILRNIVNYAQSPESMARFVEGTDLIFVGTAFTTEHGANGLSIADFPFDMPDVRHEIRWSISKEADAGHAWLKDIIFKATYEDLDGCYRRDPAEGFTLLSEFEELDS